MECDGQQTTFSGMESIKTRQVMMWWPLEGGYTTNERNTERLVREIKKIVCACAYMCVCVCVCVCVRIRETEREIEETLLPEKKSFNERKELSFFRYRCSLASTALF